MKHACTICTKSYSRKYLLNKHLKEVHGVEGDKCTRNFNCPFKCGVGSYRTNIELLRHCEEVHQTSLGMVCTIYPVHSKTVSITVDQEIFGGKINSWLAGTMMINYTKYSLSNIFYLQKLFWLLGAAVLW